MHAAVELAVRVQDIDLRIAELMREIAALPRHVAEIEKKLESHKRKLEADQAALAANQRERKKLEGDIQVQEQKISKLKGQMLDAKTNEQYRAFQHEIEYCEKEIRKCEDRILDLMGESEPLDKNVKAAAAALKVEQAEVEKEKAEARTRTEADKSELAKLQQTRKETVAALDPAVYRNYERVRARGKGIGVAEVVEGRCSVCHMALRLQFFQELKRDEQPMYCESCGRVLYYNPPVAFDEATGAPAPAAAE